MSADQLRAMVIERAKWKPKGSWLPRPSVLGGRQNVIFENFLPQRNSRLVEPPTGAWARSSSPGAGSLRGVGLGAVKGGRIAGAGLLRRVDRDAEALQDPARRVRLDDRLDDPNRPRPNAPNATRSSSSGGTMAAIRPPRKAGASFSELAGAQRVRVPSRLQIPPCHTRLPAVCFTGPLGVCFDACCPP